MANHRHLPALMVALLAAAAPHVAHAQPAAAAEHGISGRVVEAGTGRAIARASVALLNDQGLHVTGATADAEGNFHLRVSTPGRYRLRADRVGYRRSTSEAI